MSLQLLVIAGPDKDRTYNLKEGADLMLGEVQPLLLRQCGLEVARAAEQAGLALLADAALEHGLDEDFPVAVDQGLDLFFAGGRSEDFGGRKADELQQAGAVKHAGDVHGDVSLRWQPRHARPLPCRSAVKALSVGCQRHPCKPRNAALEKARDVT